MSDRQRIPEEDGPLSEVRSDTWAPVSVPGAQREHVSQAAPGLPSGTQSPQSAAAAHRGYERPEDAGPLLDRDAAFQAGISAAEIEARLSPPLSQDQLGERERLREIRESYARPEVIAAARADLERRAQEAYDRVMAGLRP